MEIGVERVWCRSSETSRAYRVDDGGVVDEDVETPKRFHTSSKASSHSAFERISSVIGIALSPI